MFDDLIENIETILNDDYKDWELKYTEVDNYGIKLYLINGITRFMTCIPLWLNDENKILYIKETLHYHIGRGANTND